jgi:hypothetical protein
MSVQPSPSSHQRPLGAGWVALATGAAAGTTPTVSRWPAAPGAPGIGPPPSIPHTRSPAAGSAKNTDVGRRQDRVPCMPHLLASPSSCRTCWSRIPASSHGCFRWRPRGHGAGSGNAYPPVVSHPKQKGVRVSIYAETAPCQVIRAECSGILFHKCRVVLRLMPHAVGQRLAGRVGKLLSRASESVREALRRSVEQIVRGREACFYSNVNCRASAKPKQPLHIQGAGGTDPKWTRGSPLPPVDLGELL